MAQLIGNTSAAAAGVASNGGGVMAYQQWRNGSGLAMWQWLND